MKLELDELIISTSKQSLISSITDLRDLATKQSSEPNKILIEDIIKSLRCVYNNLELANKPKPFRKTIIVNKDRSK
tara:strand:+ start:1988 stop:2215 length:228 start_codon:yes stop_codon:yes gene_type:complete